MMVRDNLELSPTVICGVMSVYTRGVVILLSVPKYVKESEQRVNPFTPLSGASSHIFFTVKTFTCFTLWFYMFNPHILTSCECPESSESGKNTPKCTRPAQ